MILRRRFFWIWLVLATFWLIIVAVYSYGGIVKPFIGLKSYLLRDTTATFHELEQPWLIFDPGFTSNHWQVNFPNNVTLFVTNDISKDFVSSVSDSFADKYSKPREAELSWARLKALGLASVIGVVPPLALLMLGLWAGWIGTGFKRNARRESP